MTIGTPAQLASRVQQDVDTATAELLLMIAEDLIVSEIGIMSPWPARVLGIQLDAAARAYVNPAGVAHELFETYTRSGIPAGGVYLTTDEKARLGHVRGRAGIVSVPLITPAEASEEPIIFSGDWP